MANTIVQNSFVQNQSKYSSKDGDKNMLRKAFRTFLDSIIRENATHRDDCYNLFASDLSYYDKKMFMTYLITPDDYEDFTSNSVREREAIKEYEKEMQYLIDDRINDLYHEDMREMGLVLNQHRDNGEFYYTQR